MFGIRKRVAKKESRGDTDRPEIHCSFCNKSQRQVQTLIAGPNVHICDECVDICLGILNEPGRGDPTPDAEGGSPGWIAFCALCQMPADTEQGLHLDERGILCPACVAAIEAALGRNATR
jgi:hypothetical protein